MGAPDETRTTSDPASGADDLARARRRVDDATRAARQARIVAAGVLRARARRRSSRFRVAVVGCVAVLVVALGGLVTLWVQNRDAAGGTAAEQAALEASRAGIAALLTADPADPAAYIDRALAVTTGEQHDRIREVADALSAEVRGMKRPSSGTVLSAGLVSDPPSYDGTVAVSLVVAEASDPALVGADPGQNRVTVEVTVTRVGSKWLISGTEPA
ncbi:hypothetical protein V1Y59_00350 [Gordonia sp. PKS22-38]|uniref:Mce-associated membrane protein n=1 Tax=Gordonia prachuapensis TaxID=3115651 RepID=A0ABU7MMF1_9ACTN|nr:hypothetical protein [Gordonia sp. PKS22-38]